MYDSKTLNERKSIGKNWQNMINDLSTDATTVHTRFPMCIVAFIVAVPRPALDRAQERDLVRTLARLGTRSGVLDQAHLAEAIALVVWNPTDGSIAADVPPRDTNLRIEDMHARINDAYLARYANLPLTRKPRWRSAAGRRTEARRRRVRTCPFGACPGRTAGPAAWPTPP